MDWNSRLTPRREKSLREYASENTCQNFGTDTPSSNPFNPSATPDVLDIAVTKDVPFQVYLPSCYSLSSGHLQVLIDTALPTSFPRPPERPNFRRTEWAIFQTQVADRIPFDPESQTGMTIDTYVENFYGAVLQALAECIPQYRPRETHCLRYRPVFRTKRLRKRWQITREPALKDEVNSLQCSVTPGSMSGGTTSRVRHSNPSIPKTNRCGG